MKGTYHVPPPERRVAGGAPCKLVGGGALREVRDDEVGSLVCCEPSLAC